jgi:hypothetical protein
VQRELFGTLYPVGLTLCVSGLLNPQAAGFPECRRWITGGRRDGKSVRQQGVQVRHDDWVARAQRVSFHGQLSVVNNNNFFSGIFRTSRFFEVVSFHHQFILKEVLYLFQSSRSSWAGEIFIAYTPLSPSAPLSLSNHCQPSLSRFGVSKPLVYHLQPLFQQNQQHASSIRPRVPMRHLQQGIPDWPACQRQPLPVHRTFPARSGV